MAPNLRNSRIRCRIYTGFRKIEERSFENNKKKLYSCYVAYFRIIVTYFLDKLCLHTPTEDVQNELAAELEVLLSPLVKVLRIKY